MHKKQPQFLGKFLLFVGLFFVLFGSTHLSTALAQFDDNGNYIGGDGSQFNPTTYIPGGQGPVGGPVGVSGVANPGGGGGTSVTTGAGAVDDGTRENTLPQTPQVPATDEEKWILKIVHSMVLGTLGTLVGWAGYLFDLSLRWFIIEFGAQYRDYNIGFTVNSLWSTVRDIFNLTFIFGLVYIGFKMILDSGDHHARQMLVSLIGAALLVNFSLFITKFIVDFSNIAAYQIYSAFEPSTAGAETIISAGFANLFGLNSILKPAEVPVNELGWSYIIGLIVVFLVLTYVFLAGAIMIIIRFGLLTIYLIFSPLMFLGWVFPAMKKHSEEYWNGFLGQAFFAPAFVFMLYLSYRVASNYRTEERSIGHVFNNGLEGGANTLAYFALVVVFLVASIVVAKKIGDQGANSSMSALKYIRGKGHQVLGGATFGVAARAGRTAIGGTAHALAGNKSFQKTMNNNFIGRGVLKATNKVADSSFDARNFAGVGSQLGIGDGKKGGFATRLKESKEADEKYLKLLSTYSAEDDPTVIARNKEVARLKNALTGARDDEREELAHQLVVAEKALQDAKSAFKPEQEYANHLAYIESMKKWQSAKSLMLGGALGVGAGLLTGGLLPGVAIAAGAGLGAQYHSKQDIKALKKAYGDDGTKMKKSKAQKEAMEEMAKIIKETAGDHHDDKKSAGHSTHAAPAASSKPATHASAGGDHGHH